MRASDLPVDLQRKLLGKTYPKPTLTRFQESPEEAFERQCKLHRLPAHWREHRFAEAIGRGWRMDFAWEAPWMIAVEVEGLLVRRINGELIVGGRHVTPEGFKADSVKYAHAAILGWTVLRFEQSQVKDGTAIELLIQLLRSKGWRP